VGPGQVCGLPRSIVQVSLYKVETWERVENNSVNATSGKIVGRRPMPSAAGLWTPTNKTGERRRMLEQFAPVICIVFCLAAGFYLGKRHERQAWNQLIDEGRIRTPAKKTGWI
jgi:hypothetical protein